MMQAAGRPVLVRGSNSCCVGQWTFTPGGSLWVKEHSTHVQQTGRCRKAPPRAMGVGLLILAGTILP